MRCPKCGQITPDDSRFCGFCGAKIEPPSGGSPIPPPPPIGYPAPPWFEGGGPEPPRRGGRTALIIVLAALLLAAAALIIFLLAGRSGEGGSEAPPASAPAQTESAESAPPETEPVETEPAETEPAETEPVETEPEFEAEAVTLYYKGEAAGGGRLYMYADGSKLQISAQVTPARELPAGAYVWSSSDESVATVTPGPDGSSCTLTRQGPGECVISVSVAGAEDSLSVAAVEGVTADTLFESLPDYFYFSYNVGGWWTRIYIGSDGSFYGTYIDSDYSNPYPERDDIPLYYDYWYNRYCSFSGRFELVEQVSEYEFRLRVASLSYDNEPGGVYVDDEEKSVYIYETPRGLDGSEEFTLYLPGRPTSDLPAGFINYIMQATNDFTSYERMRYWGLRNMGTEEGFVGMNGEFPGEPAT